MAPTKGFFSVVQFCPDLDRGECANVGVVLAVPSLGFLGVRLSDDNEGPKQRFGREVYDDARLTIAKKAIAGRVLHEGREWKASEDLLEFAKKEGNNILFSTPRTILVENANAELEELFQRLAHVDARQRRRPPPPDLKKTFEDKLAGVALQRDLKIDVPQLGTIDVPYAYQNGVLNLVRPEGFPVNPASASEKASDLAVKGHIIFNQSKIGGAPKKLIIVGGFDPSMPEEVKSKIAYVLREHDARLVREDQIEAFVDEVRREAHH